MKIQDGVDRVRALMVDEGDTPQNDDPKIVDLLNDATSAILNIKPTAKITTKTIAITSGSQQTLAAGVIMLHDIYANVTGGAIRRIDRTDLDSFSPGWLAFDEVSAVEHWFFDDTNPRAFFVYPPNDGTGSVRASVTEIPARVTDLQGDLPLSDDFIDAYVYYVAYRLKDAESDEVNNANQADRFYARFMEVLGVKIQNRGSFSPNMRPQ